MASLGSASTTIGEVLVVLTAPRSPERRVIARSSHVCSRPLEIWSGGPGHYLNSGNDLAGGLVELLRTRVAGKFAAGAER